MLRPIRGQQVHRNRIPHPVRAGALAYQGFGNVEAWRAAGVERQDPTVKSRPG